ncbi:hypothetical protein E8E11_007353 [Didymella keratinophila]|nr:hypothetical protein E8E11_007353 [Didymella keratinophila]
MHFPLSHLALLTTSALSWTLISGRPSSSHELVRRELDYYEEGYINTRNYKHSNATVKLVGFKKIKIPDADVDEFEEGWHTSFEEYKRLERHFYDAASRELRIYFPVENALVEHGSHMIEANELGEFEMDWLDGDYAVVGRYQTDHVHGVDTNIVKDGVIYLSERVLPHRRVGNVFVYDFGYKDVHDHDDHSHDVAKRCENVECPSQGCVKNHGGVNCSKKFGISKGRCPMRKDVCMDFNGVAVNLPGVDCSRPTSKAKRILKFPGSDCDYAVGAGHCYNEVAAFH